MSPPKLALSFRMFQNGRLIREDALTQGVIKIGKMASAHLQIADEGVSRMHAIVEVTGREVSLIDLGSARGTFVNGRRINKARLETGDVITLGDTRLEIEIGDAAAARSSAPRAGGPAEGSSEAAREPSIDQAPERASDRPTERPLDHAGLRPPAIPAAARHGATQSVVSGVIETVAGSATRPASNASLGGAPPAAAPHTPSEVTARPSGPVRVAGTVQAPRDIPAPSVSFGPAVPSRPSVSAKAAASSVPSVLSGAAAPSGPSSSGAAASSVPSVSSGSAAPSGSPVPSAVSVPSARLAAPPLDPAGRRAVFSHAVADSADELGAARAIEVAAMLGDSVVNVKHCIDPRSGKVTPATWALLAAGAACLLASAIAFYASVHNAGENRARLDAWTRVEHKPGYAFRPHTFGPAVDWLAFGGLGLALVGLTLGAVRMRSERTSPGYRIGTAAGVDLALDGAPASEFPLVAPSGDDFVFNYGDGIDGEIVIDGHATPLGELAAAGRSRPSPSIGGAIEVPIPARARIRARIGRATLLISAVARPRRHAVPLLAGLENRALSYFAGSLVVHLAIWGLLQMLPPEATGVSLDTPTDEHILARLSGTAKNDPVPERIDDAGDATGKQGGAPMPLPSGASGKPDAIDHGRVQVAKADAPPAMTHDEALDYVRESGVLGVLASASGVRVLDASDAIASGIDRDSFNGPLHGGEGEGPGAFGGGFNGDRFGGGCAVEPCGTIPSGNRFGDGNRIGTSRSRGDDYRIPGRGVGGPTQHHTTLPRIGDPQMPGTYDKAIIRRYIRRNIDKIAYCYDKQLLAHPDLQGTITATFFILPTGEVRSSSGTGFDPEVASCVAAVIKTIEFPRPGDAAAAGVQVTYPFHFHAPG